MYTRGDITKNEAIRECKEIWGKIKAAGGNKLVFFAKNKEYKCKYKNDCPLCHYAAGIWDNDYNRITRAIFKVTILVQQSLSGLGYIEPYCGCCPLLEQYKKCCIELGFHCAGAETNKWYDIVEGLKEEEQCKAKMK